MKIIKLIAIMAMILMLTASCEMKEKTRARMSYSGETSELILSFPTTVLSTRTFFEDVKNFAERESRIYNMKIFLYGETGELVQSYYIPSFSELSNYLSINVPREVCGQECNIFAIANCSPDQNGTNNMQDMWIYDNVGYDYTHFNTTVQNHLSGGLDYKFMMSGYTSFYMKPYGMKTTASIQLTRLVSKVAVRYKIDDNFRSNHGGGMIRIKGAYLTYSAASCFVFPNSVNLMTGQTFNPDFYQEPFYHDGYYHNIFYVFENQILERNQPKTGIKITGIYDHDGDFLSVWDQSPISWTFDVGSIPWGKVNRNTYYKIEAVIRGVGVNNLDLNFSVKEWLEEENFLDI